MEHSTATAVMSPKVSAAPVLSATELAIMPATPTTQMTATIRRTALSVMRQARWSGLYLMR